MLFNEMHFNYRGNLREYCGNIHGNIAEMFFFACFQIFSPQPEISVWCVLVLLRTSLRFEEMSWCDWTGFCEQQGQHATSHVWHNFIAVFRFHGIPRCAYRMHIPREFHRTIRTKNTPFCQKKIHMDMFRTDGQSLSSIQFFKICYDHGFPIT